MERFDFGLIIMQMRNSLAYFLIGALFGSGFASFLFILDKKLLETVISVWLTRATFGLKYLGGDYRLWFILNNFVAFLMIIVALVLLIGMFIKRRKFHVSYFAKYEKSHPKITLYSLYMMPIGALVINGALISLFLTFILLNEGFAKFSTALTLMTPHGLYEFIALILASSYGLAYIQLIKPFILKRDWKSIKKTSRQIFYSQTSIVFIFMILILVVFGGIIEGTLSILIGR